MTYQECMETCLVEIKKYHTARRNEVDKFDPWIFQDIRDELSEALVHFGPLYADLRADAEQAENDRKIHYETRKEFWKDHFEGKRGTASLAESKALQDCEDIMKSETEANRKYYQARTLVERIDQVLNGTASRLKLLEKHGKN